MTNPKDFSNEEIESYYLEIEGAFEPGNNEFGCVIGNKGQFPLEKNLGKEIHPVDELDFPNVYYKMVEGFELEEQVNGNNLAASLGDIYRNMAFHLVNTDLKGYYICGEKAIGKNGITQYSGIKAKSDSPLPIINTLAVIASRAIKQALNDEEYEDGTLIEVNVTRTVTTLPLGDYYSNPDKNKAYSNKYVIPDDETEVENNRKAQEFNLVYYIADKKIDMVIYFEEVLVLPEAVSAHYGLILMDTDDKFYQDLLGDLIKENTGIDITEELSPEEKQQAVGLIAGNASLHYDLGSGTSDRAVLDENTRPLSIHCKGIDFNVHDAISSALPEIQAKIQDEDFTVANVNDLFINPPKAKFMQKNREIALDLVKKQLKKKTNVITDDVENKIKELYRTNIYPRFAFFYGGGSILIKDDIYNDLAKITSAKDVELVYVPEEYATILNLQGNKRVLEVPDIYIHLRNFHYNMS